MPGGTGAACPGPFLRLLSQLGESAQGQAAPPSAAGASAGTPVLLSTPPTPTLTQPGPFLPPPSRAPSRPPRPLAPRCWLSGPRAMSVPKQKELGLKGNAAASKSQFSGPIHTGPQSIKGADVLQVTRWLERAQPGRCGAGRLRALHSWTVGQSLSHGLRSEPPEVNHCRVDSPAHGASTHCPLCETGT